MPEAPLVLAAPAKVNLYLAVGGTRPDGYHDVTTILQAIELHDTVTVRFAEELEVVCEPDLGVVPEANSAHRAAKAFGMRVGREPAVAVRIEKRIPEAAGLGGGSADAAAVIAALAHLWEEDPTGDLALAAAAEVGADVPFFLVGGTALFDRRGDRLVSRLTSLEAAVVLVNPRVHTPTGAVYAVFDELEHVRTPGVRRIADALQLEPGDIPAVASRLHNALAPAAETVAPELSTCRSWLASQDGVLGCEVAGSGATVFGLCRDDEAAASAALRAGERGWWAVGTRTRSRGVAFVEEVGGP